MNVQISKSLLASLICTACALAGTVPFTEEFETDAAGWYDTPGSLLLAWASDGGPDNSSHAMGAFNFLSSSPGDTPLLFRAQDEFNSSGGAFEGNWITGGVSEFSAFVRHDAGLPLTYFVRFSSPFNFPGAVALNFAPVPSTTWTLISFEIDPGSPQFISFEGSDFETVFSNIGHVQIGASVPEGLAGIDQGFVFGLDKAAIIPEPGTLAILLLGSGACLGCRARRSRPRRLSRAFDASGSAKR